MSDVLKRLLRPGPVLERASVRELHAALIETTRGLLPVDVALVAGSLADRLGFAFVGGYGAALAAMVPSLPCDELAAFCATESGGVHPRAIETVLERSSSGRLRVTGKKTFVTFGADADVLVVLARTGTATGEDGKERPVLAAVRVSARAAGVSSSPLPEMPFTPEIQHASLVLEGVEIDPGDVLPGDGYDAYLKPFRTIEDVYVHAALVGYLCGVAARTDAPRPLRERLLFEAQAYRSLAALPADAVQTHIALAGAMASTRRLVTDCEPMWSAVSAEERARWQRDQPLLSVASKARAQRLELAWRRASEGA